MGERAVCPSSDVLGMKAETSLKSLAEKPPACSPSRYLTCFKSAGVLGRLLLRRGAATGASAMDPTDGRGGGAAIDLRRRRGRRGSLVAAAVPNSAIQFVGEGAAGISGTPPPKRTGDL